MSQFKHSIRWKTKIDILTIEQKKEIDDKGVKIIYSPWTTLKSIVNFKKQKKKFPLGVCESAYSSHN